MNLMETSLKEISFEESQQISGGGFWKEVGWWTGAIAKEMYNGVVGAGEAFAEAF